MNLTDIADTRLVSQHIAGARLGTVKDLVGWMGAMQAQEYAMAKWSVGVRLPGSTVEIIDGAIASGDIIRTHLLRPTWHFVAADDVYWMIALTGPQIKAGLALRHRELELDETVFSKSNSVIEKALGAGKHLLREELVAELRRANIATDNARASHLFMRAELDGIACSGATRGGKPTYALLAARVPKARFLAREEALASLAKRYFTSRCPATVQDFAWWSGLTAGDARHALQMVQSDFGLERFDAQDYWLCTTSAVAEAGTNLAYLLPTFDELILSYKDRRAPLPFSAYNKAVSNNGVWRPVIVVNGRVIGIWKRTIAKGTVLIETGLFARPDAATWRLIEEAAVQYGHFLGKEIEVTYGEYGQQPGRPGLPAQTPPAED